MHFFNKLNMFFAHQFAVKFTFLGFSILLALAFGFIIYLKNNRSTVNKIFLRIAFFSAFAIIAELFIDFFIMIKHKNIGSLSSIDVPFTLYLSFLYLKFTYYYPYEKITKKTKIFLNALLGVTIILSALSLTNLFINNRRIVNGIYYRDYTVLYYITVSFAIVVFLSSWIHLKLKMNNTKDKYYRFELKKVMYVLSLTAVFLIFLFVFLLPLFNVKNLDFFGKCLVMDIGIIVIGSSLMRYNILGFKDEIKEIYYYTIFFVTNVIPLLLISSYILYEIYIRNAYLFYALLPVGIAFISFIIYDGLLKVKEILAHEKLNELNKKTNIKNDILQYIVTDSKVEDFIKSFLNIMKEDFNLNKAELYIKEDKNEYFKYTTKNSQDIILKENWADNKKFDRIVYYDVLRQKSFEKYKNNIITFMEKNGYYYIIRSSFFYNGNDINYLLCLSNRNDGGLIKKYDLLFVEEITIFLSMLLSIMYMKHDIYTIESKLIESQRMKNLAIMLSRISHDFNNILYSINNEVTVLESQHKIILPETESIKLLTKRALNTFNDIFYYSRDVDNKKNEVNLIDVIRNAIELLSKTKGKRVKFLFKHSPEVVIVNDKNNQLVEIFINIFINAIEAISNKFGKIYINVGLSRPPKFISRDFNGKYIFVAIKDNGKGIDRKYIDKIFSSYYTTKHIDSLGLGLFVVKSIVEDMNGIIEVDSTKGKGTIFYIALPYEKIVYDTKLDEYKNEMGKKKFSGTVLVVDDERVILESTKKIFKLLGFNVISASSGSEALDMFNKYRKDIDLIFTDIFMPDYTGIEVVKRIKKHDKNIKVIFASGWTNKQEVTEIEKEENFRFIPKPYTIQQIILYLKELGISK